ncbi:hypothetical protein AAG570_003582 [Ranatra chinensis]|uniref:RRM domain-containing protein n=1 Tax=Ranatra chinensis TaxID=642074 RepID=A0ABD0Y4F5_9HEMI
MSVQDQPDPDYIKMFVGQVPRSMDEADLTKMFSEFGRVHQINVLRDKVSGQSKGIVRLIYLIYQTFIWHNITYVSKQVSQSVHFLFANIITRYRYLRRPDNKKSKLSVANDVGYRTVWFGQNRNFS